VTSALKASLISGSEVALVSGSRGQASATLKGGVETARRNDAERGVPSALRQPGAKVNWYRVASLRGSVGVKTPLRGLSHVNAPGIGGVIIRGELVSTEPIWLSRATTSSNRSSKVVVAVGGSELMTSSTRVEWSLGPQLESNRPVKIRLQTARQEVRGLESKIENLRSKIPLRRVECVRSAAVPFSSEAFMTTVHWFWLLRFRHGAAENGTTTSMDTPELYLPCTLLC
jgi:hypothetical protein